MAGRPPLPGRTPSPRSARPARWIGDGAALAITIWGSSSAPTVITRADVEGQRVTLNGESRNAGGEPVTADLSPYVTVIRTPAGLDLSAPVVVVLGGRGYDLPPPSEQQDEPHIHLRAPSPPPGL